MPEGVWALHRSPHSAGIAQAPRSLCHKLTYPLLQRDGERPAKAWGTWALHGPASELRPAPHWQCDGALVERAQGRSFPSLVVFEDGIDE